jgi:hypothetical protein
VLRAVEKREQQSVRDVRDLARAVLKADPITVLAWPDPAPLGIARNTAKALCSIVPRVRYVSSVSISATSGRTIVPVGALGLVSG